MQGASPCSAACCSHAADQAQSAARPRPAGRCPAGAPHTLRQMKRAPASSCRLRILLDGRIPRHSLSQLSLLTVPTFRESWLRGARDCVLRACRAGQLASAVRARVSPDAARRRVQSSTARSGRACACAPRGLGARPQLSKMGLRSAGLGCWPSARRALASSRRLTPSRLLTALRRIRHSQSANRPPAAGGGLGSGRGLQRCVAAAAQLRGMARRGFVAALQGCPCRRRCAAAPREADEQSMSHP
jgi:hypothetical protein